MGAKMNAFCAANREAGAGVKFRSPIPHGLTVGSILTARKSR